MTTVRDRRWLLDVHGSRDTAAVSGGPGGGKRRAVVIKRPAVPKIMDLLKET